MYSQIKKERIESFIKTKISQILLTKINDSFLKLATITSVNLSPDLHNAKIFVDSFDRSKTLKIVKNLNNNSVLFRNEIAQEISLRKCPKIFFEVDTTIDKAINLQKILDEEKKVK